MSRHQAAGRARRAARPLRHPLVEAHGLFLTLATYCAVLAVALLVCNRAFWGGGLTMAARPLYASLTLGLVLAGLFCLWRAYVCERRFERSGRGERLWT